MQGRSQVQGPHNLNNRHNEVIFHRPQTHNRIDGDWGKSPSQSLVKRDTSRVAMVGTTLKRGGDSGSLKAHVTIIRPHSILFFCYHWCWSCLPGYPDAGQQLILPSASKPKPRTRTFDISVLCLFSDVPSPWRNEEHRAVPNGYVCKNLIFNSLCSVPNSFDNILLTY